MMLGTLACDAYRESRACPLKVCILEFSCAGWVIRTHIVAPRLACMCCTLDFVRWEFTSKSFKAQYKKAEGYGRKCRRANLVWRVGWKMTTME